MKKEGFTLVELLAVIVILAVLLLLVTPSLFNSAKASREKSFKTKIGLIETSAIMYGQDNYRTIINGVNENKPGYALTDGFNTQTLEVRDLIPEYLTKDIEEGQTLNGKIYYIQDPRDNSRFLDDYKIIIKINPKTRKVTAEFQTS